MKPIEESSNWPMELSVRPSRWCRSSEADVVDLGLRSVLPVEPGEQHVEPAGKASSAEDEPKVASLLSTSMYCMSKSSLPSDSVPSLAPSPTSMSPQLCGVADHVELGVLRGAVDGREGSDDLRVRVGRGEMEALKRRRDQMPVHATALEGQSAPLDTANLYVIARTSQVSVVGWAVPRDERWAWNRDERDERLASRMR